MMPPASSGEMDSSNVDTRIIVVLRLKGADVPLLVDI